MGGEEGHALEALVRAAGADQREMRRPEEAVDHRVTAIGPHAELGAVTPIGGMHGSRTDPGEGVQNGCQPGGERHEPVRAELLLPVGRDDSAAGPVGAEALARCGPCPLERHAIPVAQIPAHDEHAEIDRPRQTAEHSGGVRREGEAGIDAAAEAHRCPSPSSMRHRVHLVRRRDADAPEQIRPPDRPDLQVFVETLELGAARAPVEPQVLASRCGELGQGDGGKVQGGGWHGPNGLGAPVHEVALPEAIGDAHDERVGLDNDEPRPHGPGCRRLHWRAERRGHTLRRRCASRARLRRVPPSRQSAQIP